jgi:hypothetical protein
MSSSQLNMAPYTNSLNNLEGGRKRKRSRRARTSRRRQNNNRNHNNQNGGFFPGIGEVVSQAIVPFGLYAAQHKFKSSSRSKAPANYSLKKFKKFKFTRRV